MKLIKWMNEFNAWPNFMEGKNLEFASINTWTPMNFNEEIKSPEETFKNMIYCFEYLEKKRPTLDQSTPTYSLIKAILFIKDSDDLYFRNLKNYQVMILAGILHHLCEFNNVATLQECKNIIYHIHQMSNSNTLNILMLRNVARTENKNIFLFLNHSPAFKKLLLNSNEDCSNWLLLPTSIFHFDGNIRTNKIYEYKNESLDKSTVTLINKSAYWINNRLDYIMNDVLEIFL